MLVVAFLVALVATTALSNHRGEQRDTVENLEFPRKHSFVIFGLLVSSVVGQWLYSGLEGAAKVLVVVVAVGVYTCVMMVLNVGRERQMKERQEYILRVYQALADILGKFNQEKADLSAPPFEYELDPKTGNVYRIRIDTSNPDARINDNTIILAQYSLNKFFPEFDWISDFDAPNRVLKYTGIPKPPKLAEFPGTDYRPSGWIPLGVTGSSGESPIVEVGWNLCDPKDAGQSLFFDTEGHQAGTLDLPSSPQCMTLGSTGGGKAIWVDQEIW